MGKVVRDCIMKNLKKKQKLPSAHLHADQYSSFLQFP